MKIRRKIITIDEEKCDGCGLCTEACSEGAIRIEGGKARLIAEKYCDGLGACLGECPQGAITIAERDAEAFDEVAVEAHLQQHVAPVADALPMACGCPSSHIETFSRPSAGDAPPLCAAAPRGGSSELTHWPVQIRLVPPTAPFLENADLLVAADCTPVACGRFQEDFVKGRAVMLGCPKFDDVEDYVEKFAQIFQQAHIRSIVVLVMEVPCCQGLPVILQRAMALSGKRIPVERVVVSTRGEIVEKQTL